MTAHGAGVIVLGPGEGRQLQGPNVVLKAGKDAAQGGYALLEMTGFPPGLWIPPHIHHEAAEAWYVLEGEFTFRVAERSIPAVAGSFILVPRGIVHTFGNTGPRPAALLELFSPAGMEEYFAERTALAEAASATSEPDYAGIDPAAHAALAKKYQMDFV